MILAVLAVAALAATATPAENLLRNPGFESVLVDRPDAWDVFVLPQEGAFARTAREAHSGDLAVLLHTPLPYSKDPANNWSQNVEGDWAGATLHAGAWIRTEEAGGAALWVQCWQRRPLRLLLTASTAQRDPVRGTQDWREVNMPVEVPPGTDFITFRCVLTGTGSAWFDDAFLQRQDDAKPPVAPAASPSVPPDQAPAKTPVSVPPPVATDQEDTLLMLDQMQRELDALRDANLMLGEALDQVRAENQQLLKDLNDVRATVGNLDTGTPGEPAAKDAPPAPAAVAPATPPPPPVPPKRPVPILVPHGVDWRTQP